MRRTVQLMGAVCVAVAALATLAACGSETGSPAEAIVSGTGTGTTARSGTGSAAGVVRVAPEEGRAMLQEQGAAITLIDVRTPDEYAAGHIEGAVNMDLEGGQFSTLIQDLPKDAAYMVYCHTGRRAAIAADTMIASGFTTVYDLGGIQAWQDAGLPLVTG